MADFYGIIKNSKESEKTMWFRKLNRNLSLIFCLSGTIVFLALGCHGKKVEKSEAKKQTTIEDVKVITVPEQAIKSREEFRNFLKNNNITGITTIPPRQLVGQAKDMVTSLMLLDIPDKNKKEFDEILKYLDNIKSPSEYLDDDNNIIAFMQTIVRSCVILTEIEPDNFDVNYPIAYHYINTGSLIKSLSQSENHKLISVEYKRKGFQAAKDLVKKFPYEAKAYHQLAFFVNIVEGDKKRALELYKHCLELDPKMELCQKHYDIVLEELDK